MQFGIDKFLEMFERRFGRWLTTILLALIALGIAALMVNLVVQNAVKPIADGVDKLTEGEGIDWRNAILQVLVAVGVTTASVVVFWIVATWLQRRWKREADRWKLEGDRLLQELLRVHKKTEEVLERSVLMDAETRKLVDEIERKQHAEDEAETPLEREEGGSELSS